MGKIDEFLENFSASTQRSYKAVLKRYFKIIKKEPDTYFKNKRKYSEKELEPYEKDVKTFWHSIKQLPYNTVKAYMAAIRVFLQENYVDLSRKFWKDLRIRKKGSRAVVEDIVPTKMQWKKILSHGKALDRAMILTLLSSGMRIGELCQIKEQDINFKFNPTKIEIRGEYTKTGNRRTVYISDETSDALKEWLLEKPEYLKRAVKILNFPQYTKNVNDERVFPMDPNIARVKWNRLLMKSGFVEQDNSTTRPRYKIHPHVTRKYYRTWMAKDIGKDLCEYFLGHEQGLDAIYRRYGDDSNKRLLGDEYLKGMHNVTIFTTDSEEIIDIKEQLQEKDKQIQELLEFKKIMELKIQGLETRLEVEKLKNNKK